MNQNTLLILNNFDYLADKNTMDLYLILLCWMWCGNELYGASIDTLIAKRKTVNLYV